MINRTFNYLSYLRYGAYLWGGWVAFPELIERTDQILSNVGFGLFLFGIGLALEGFKDSEGYSKLELRLFANEKRAKGSILINALFQCFAIAFGVFCFNIAVFYPEVTRDIAAQVKELGYGSLAVGIGGVGLAKEQLNRLESFTRARSVSGARSS